MSYKTILVHVDQTPRAPARIALAARLAGEHGAHLVGGAMIGISRYVFSSSNIDITRTVLDEQLKVLASHADAALAQFEAIVAGVSALSFERRQVDDDEAPGLAQQARYADLVALSQSDPNARLARIAPDLASYVMLHSACPVLIMPFAGAPATLGHHPLIAWDDSVQASRAVTQALPLLQRARKVSLAVFNAGSEPLLAGAAMARYLARHGVNVEVLHEETEFDVGFALLELAAMLGADLLVMGGYGHARLREVLLGGGAHQHEHSGFDVPLVSRQEAPHVPENPGSHRWFRSGRAGGGCRDRLCASQRCRDCRVFRGAAISGAADHRRRDDD